MNSYLCPPPAYYREQARLGPALHIDALTLVTTLHLLVLCRLAVSLHGLSISIKSARASSAWMPPIGGYASSPGFMPPWARSPLSAFYPKRQKNRSCLPPTWRHVRNWANVVPSNASLAASFSSFTRPRLPLAGWSTLVRQVALTYTATIIVALAAQQAGRPDLIRSPKRVLAHTWEGFEL